MSTALLRRAPGCASDLTIDRWLLGELPNSDAGRRFEDHLRSCAECGSRVRSLRQLYAHQRTQSGVRAPPVQAAPPAPTPSQSGVAQVIILRDGLLVGTEVFTPGTWIIGSDARADLRLADASVRARHARLVFRGGRVGVEDLGGGLCINGFPVTRSAELRPIDETFCGPFVLRARVIEERWDEDEVPTIAHRAVRPLDRAARSLEEPPTEAHPVRALDGAEATTAAMRVVAECLADLDRLGRSELETSPAEPTPPRPRRSPAQVALRSVGAPERTGVPEALRERPAPLAPREPPRAVPAAPRPSPRATPAAVRQARPDALRLDLRLLWGDACQVARTFGPGQVVASARDDAPMPLWGFSLEESDFVVAEGDGRGYRLFVPEGVTVEQRTAEGWTALEASLTGSRRSVALPAGSAPVRLRSGPMALVASVTHAVEPVPRRALAELPWHLPALAGALFAALMAAVTLAPVQDEEPFTPREVRRLTHCLIPPKRVPPAQQKASDRAVRERTPQSQRFTRQAANRAGPVTNRVDRLTAGLRSLNTDGLEKVGEALRGTGLRRPGPPGGSLLAGLGPAVPGASSVLGVGGGDDGLGIGRSGLHGAGQLRTGRIGQGAVAGRVTRARGDRVRGVPPSMDPSKIAEVINGHIVEVQRCYETALLSNAGLQGRATLEWGIGTDGRVHWARTKSSTLQSPVVESCILARLKLWHFPSPKGGEVTVSYPFVFDRVGF